MPHSKTSENAAAQKAALRARVRRFYGTLFAKRSWQKCYEYLDPRLREQGKVDANTYAESLARFADYYGAISIRHIDISLHLDATKNRHDDRAFAYVYVFWQDKRGQFHVFRERWVRDGGDWYTRVVGLVVHERNGTEAEA